MRYAHQVGLQHQCLECSKEFNTLQACRRHMLDKPHQVIRFEGEYDQFFDIEKISKFCIKNYSLNEL